MAAPVQLSELPTLEAPISYMRQTELFKKEKPFISSVPFMNESARNTNIEDEQHNLPISNVRGHEDVFTLEKNGFQFVTHEFSHRPTGKIEGPGHPYLDEVATFLKDLLGARTVIVYDCNVRKIGKMEFFQPATYAHIDHTARNTLYRFEEATQAHPNLTFQRWQAITVWCPLSDPVTDWPLAVCDFQTVAQEDLHPVDTVLPHRVNEIYHLSFSDRHKWYYLKDQRANEPLVMKTCDTDESAAKYCAHASFDTRHLSASTEPRESADVRAFVLY